METNSVEEVQLVYEQMLKDVPFSQIEHVPDQFIDRQVSVQEGCLCITHSYFTLHYANLMRVITAKPLDLLQSHWAAEVLLLMNGENEKAWNLKKTLLLQGKLDIGRQLRFNAAVCYKNKKSSTYYQYRIRLFQELLKGNLEKEVLLALYESQSQLVTKILARFLRNYYCWMYRNRIYSLFKEHLGQQLTKLEVQHLHRFIDRNPNDYSAYSRLIAVVKDSSVDLAEQRRWLQELRDFCSAAYEKPQSYRQIDVYYKFLGKTGSE